MSLATPVIDHIDGQTRRIYLLQGVDTFHWSEDIYREYIHRRAVDEPLRLWAPLLVAKGNDPKGGGKYTSRYIVLLEGCRVIPYDENILITVKGEAITDNAEVDPDPFDTTTRTQPLKLYITPPAAEVLRDEESLAAIAHMEFNGGIYFDAVNGYEGTSTIDGKQIGTLRAPSKNMTDAGVIAAREGFNTGFIIGDVTFGAGVVIHDFTMIGEGRMRSNFTILDAAGADDCTYMDATVTGVLDGASRLLSCRVTDLTYVKGELEECLLSAGTITVAPGGIVRLLDCWTDDISSLVDVPVLDMGGSGQHLTVRNHRGGLKIINKTGPEIFTIILNGGKAIVDLATVTAGKITFEGVGGVVDQNNNPLASGMYGGLMIASDMIGTTTIATAVWDEPIEKHLVDGTTGHSMYHLAYNDTVIVDPINGSAGTLYPLGTMELPVDNLTDAITIRAMHNFASITVVGHISINGEDIRGITLKAARSLGNSVTVISATMGPTYFENLTVSGAMSGAVRLTTCVLGAITGFDGGAKNSLLTGSLEVVGTGANYLTFCDTYVTSSASIAITVGTTALNIIRGRGRWSLVGKTADNITAVDLVAGYVHVDSTCVAGNIHIGGIATVVDESSAGCTVGQGALNAPYIADTVWGYER